jgi:hypothetical protein
MGEHFILGINYFLRSAARQFPSLIESSKKAYPETNGRGVKFIFVAPNELGRTWKEGSFMHAAVYHSTKTKIRELVPGLSDDRIEYIEAEIDRYDADRELLFCFIADCVIYTRIVCVSPGPSLVAQP